MRSAFRGDRYAVTLTLPDSIHAGRGSIPGNDGANSIAERLVAWELISV
jgi:hypothetical protein